jgi:hypothetical protein
MTDIIYVSIAENLTYNRDYKKFNRKVEEGKSQKRCPRVAIYVKPIIVTDTLAFPGA